MSDGEQPQVEQRLMPHLKHVHEYLEAQLTPEQRVVVAMLALTLAVKAHVGPYAQQLKGRYVAAAVDEFRKKLVRYL